MDRTGTPYAIVAKVAFGYVRTLKIPEDRVANAVTHGWIALVRDSEMPPYTPETIWNPQIASNRRNWLNESDVNPDGE